MTPWIKVRRSKQAEFIDFLLRAAKLNGEFKGYTFNVQEIEELCIPQAPVLPDTFCACLVMFDNTSIIEYKEEDIIVNHHMNLSGLFTRYCALHPSITLTLPNYKTSTFEERSIKLLHHADYKLFSFHGLKGDLHLKPLPYTSTVFDKPSNDKSFHLKYIQDVYDSVEFSDDDTQRIHEYYAICGARCVAALTRSKSLVEEMTQILSETFLEQLTEYARRHMKASIVVSKDVYTEAAARMRQAKKPRKKRQAKRKTKTPVVVETLHSSEDSELISD